MLPMLAAAPAINFFAYIIIGSCFEWACSLVCLIVWLIIVVMQFLSQLKLRQIKQRENAANGFRIKLLNDMVEGIKSIKTNAIETYYLQKVVSVREQQAGH